MPVTKNDSEHVDLNLNPELAATLKAQAAEKGLSLNGWIMTVLSALGGAPAAAPIDYRRVAGAAGYTFEKYLRRRRAIGIKEGKARFPEIIRRARAGEPITIAIDKDPAALIIPLPIEVRQPGGLEALLSSADAAALRAALKEPFPQEIIDALDRHGEGERAGAARPDILGA